MREPKRGRVDRRLSIRSLPRPGVVGAVLCRVAEAVGAYSLAQSAPADDDIPLGERGIEGDAAASYRKSIERFADEERARIRSELSRRAEQAEQPASEAGTLDEARAQVELVGKLKRAGVVIALDALGNLTVLPAPADYDYDGLAKRLLDQPAGVESEEAQFAPETTIIYGDIAGPRPEPLLGKLPAISDVARNLNALLKISRIVHAIRDLDELRGQLLDLIFEVVPAGRGAILLADPEGQRLNSMFARMRHAWQAPLVKVSAAVTRQVLGQGIAMLDRDVPSNNELQDVEHRAASQVRSLLCVPLTVFQRVIGCIYLDSDSATDGLDNEHLTLLAAIAGITAVALDNARRLRWLEQENERLTMEISQERGLIGEGARMREVYQFLRRIAPTDATVLIEGETGTGKELAARALHRNSPRASKPFVAINCALFPAAFLESELFGRESGGFTGAVPIRGRLEVADGGVVFLDEVSELAPTLQVKLLRVLQEREFQRIGGAHPIRLDIRVIAATNRDLAQAVLARTFRQDLYYRLAVLNLTMPTLRERREDIPALARHFVQEHARRLKVKPRQVSSEALACLLSYDWPGNVRELENAIEVALVSARSEMILRGDLPESVRGRRLSEMTEAEYHAGVNELKKQLIHDAVEQTRGSYADAARILGLHPDYLDRLIGDRGLPGDKPN
ncbi:MAG TPA: sigma 54-interacting transcriptional regulator [Candidatus Acidoferrum sp.]|jgi:transcriptional regulator with GAF, ATPase, and Fis domain|nr:sigma 54-interacting transcriptional regulator [Candidatus Acidoferrum sp.]